MRYVKKIVLALSVILLVLLLVTGCTLLQEETSSEITSSQDITYIPGEIQQGEPDDKIIEESMEYNLE